MLGNTEHRKLRKSWHQLRHPIHPIVKLSVSAVRLQPRLKALIGTFLRGVVVAIIALLRESDSSPPFIRSQQLLTLGAKKKDGFVMPPVLQRRRKYGNDVQGFVSQAGATKQQTPEQPRQEARVSSEATRPASLS